MKLSRCNTRCHAPVVRARSVAASASKQEGSWGKLYSTVGAAALTLSLAGGRRGQVVSTRMGAGSALAVEKVGDFAASGFIFKDTVDVLAMDDPEVSNVTLYISDMRRSIADKFAKDFFNDPSSASLSCIATGVPEVRDYNKIRGKSGREIFAEGKNLSLFQQKTLRVQRILDEKRSTVIYVAYSTRLTSAADEGGVSSGRYKTSVCAVPIPVPAPAVVEAPQ